MRITVRSPLPVTETDEQFRTRMMAQYAGLEKLEGTYPYTIERSVKAFRLNRFLHSLIKPEFRKQFLADPVPLFEQRVIPDGARLHQSVLERHDGQPPANLSGRHKVEPYGESISP